MSGPTFLLDGVEVPFREGETVLRAAMAAGHYIPHLCYDPRFSSTSSCRLCIVLAEGKPQASCTLPATPGLRVESEVPSLRALRRQVLQLLFTEGNHSCPACEKSGSCKLQASAYDLGMLEPHFPHQFPVRARDASHPDVILDRDRCILCELCLRASHALDGKSVFSIGRRGIHAELIVSSDSGRLVDSAIAATDHAVQLCPTGALMPKRVGFTTPIGARVYDREPLAAVETKKPVYGRGGSHGA
jgi:[NiFe] hydrogenase diaphorase moiety small subunit